MSSIIEQLLDETEGSTLDFKRDQYPFIGVPDPQKTALLKDIIAFANTTRRTTAYILIGVEENPGGRAIVHGVTEHPDDANLQQFVNAKTNRPIDFRYFVATVEGKQIGVIEIPVQSQRPFFLRKKFHALSENAAYVRRKSSTEIADPDEIARMITAQFQESQAPSLSIEFIDPESKKPLGSLISLQSQVVRVADPKNLPDYPVMRKPDPQQSLSAIERLAMGIQQSSVIDILNESQIRPFSFGNIINKNYYRDYAQYVFMKSLFKEIQFRITNTGSVLLENVLVEISIDNPEGIDIMFIGNLPERPGIYDADSGYRINAAFDDPDDVTIYRHQNGWDMEYEMRNIQPKAHSFGDVLCIAVNKTCILNMNIRIFGDNIPEPPIFTLTIDFSVDIKNIDENQLVELANQNIPKD